MSTTSHVENQETQTQPWQKRLFTAYYDAKRPGSLGGVAALARAANVSVNRTRKWLKSQPTYTLHKPARKTYPTRQYHVSNVDMQWQADLCDMQQLAKYNQGYRYIITVIDILSRHAWARPLKSKHGTDVAKALEDIFQEGRIPERLQTDEGTEFRNPHVRKVLDDYHVELFHVKSAYKAAIVERFNRTLKNKMWHHFTAKQTNVWHDKLDDFLHSYNHSVHRTIGCTPASVTPENAMDIWLKLYGNRKIPKKRGDIRVGDRVRISKVKSVFEKGYLPNWTEEEFIVDSISTKYSPISYKLRDHNGEVIDGSFYRYEIQPIDRDENIYRVERILKTERRGRDTWYFVHWKGYPSSMDSWIRQQDIVDDEGEVRQY